MDAEVLGYWKKVRHEDFVKSFKKRHGFGTDKTFANRYKYLTREQ